MTKALRPPRSMDIETSLKSLGDSFIQIKQDAFPRLEWPYFTGLYRDVYSVKPTTTTTGISTDTTTLGTVGNPEITKENLAININLKSTPLSPNQSTTSAIPLIHKFFTSAFPTRSWANPKSNYSCQDIATKVVETSKDVYTKLETLSKQIDTLDILKSRVERAIAVYKNYKEKQNQQEVMEPLEANSVLISDVFEPDVVEIDGAVVKVDTPSKSKLPTDDSKDCLLQILESVHNFLETRTKKPTLEVNEVNQVKSSDTEIKD